MLQQEILLLYTRFRPRIVKQLQVLLSKTFKNRKSFPMEILGTLTEFLFFEISTLKPILSLVPLLQTNGKLMSVLHVRFNLT